MAILRLHPLAQCELAGRPGSGVVLGAVSRADAAEVTLLLGTLGVNTAFRTASLSVTRHHSTLGDRSRPARDVLAASGVALVAALVAAGFFAMRPWKPMDVTAKTTTTMPG